MHRYTTASYNILGLSVPDWQFTALNFATFATSLYHLNRPTRTFCAPCSHSGSCDSTTLLSAYNNPQNSLSRFPIPCARPVSTLPSLPASSSPHFLQSNQRGWERWVHPWWSPEFPWSTCRDTRFFGWQPLAGPKILPVICTCKGRRHIPPVL